MPVSAKPRKKPNASNELDIEALINKGGGVPHEIEPRSDEIPKNVQIRLLPSKIAEIDTARSQRRVRISRHHWFMEAIEEKLEREGEAPSL